MRFLTSLLMLVSIAFASPAHAFRFKIPGLPDVKISSHTVENAANKVETVAHNVVVAVGDVFEKTVEVAGKVGEVVGDVFEKTVEVAGKVGEVVGDVFEKTVEVAGKVGEVVGDGLEKAAQATADAIAKTFEVTRRALSASIEATAHLASEALKSVKEIAESSINVVKERISAEVNTIEAGFHFIAGDNQSTKNALKRAEHGFKNVVKNYDDALDESLNMAFRAGKNSLFIPTKTYDAATKNNGRLTREVGKAHDQIGLVLKKASEPQNLAKIAVLYGATMVGGPLGAAVANVLYDKLILKKSMKPSDMAKSFVIGAVAGYAAQGIQGLELIKQAPYLQKAAAQIARNLTRDAGNMALNKKGYNSTEFFQSLASGLATVEFGNTLVATIAEYTVDNVEDSVTDQLIEGKLDLNKVRDAALNGFASGITNVGVETIINETINKFKPKEVERADPSTIFALNKAISKSLDGINEYEQALQQQLILLQLAHLSPEQRNIIIEDLIELNNEIKEETAQKLYGKDYSKLTSKEIAATDFTTNYKLSLSKIEIDLQSADNNSTDDGRFSASTGAALKIIGEISVVTGKKFIPIILEGGGAAVATGSTAGTVVSALSLSMAILWSPALNPDEPHEYMANDGEILIIIHPPLSPSDNEGWVLYEAAKRGDNYAKLRYLNRETDLLLASLTSTSPNTYEEELRGRLYKEDLLIQAMNGSESAKNEFISKYGEAEYRDRFLNRVSTGGTVPNNLKEQITNEVVKVAEELGIDGDYEIAINAELLKRVESNFKVSKVENGLEVNARDFVGNGWEPAYKNGVKVIEFERTQPMEPKKYVRVSDNDDTIVGNWYTNYEEIKGLTPKQIQEKLNLRNEPKIISAVNVPVGTQERMGLVGENKFGNGSGAIQFQILDDVKDSWFTKIGDL